MQLMVNGTIDDLIEPANRATRTAPLHHLRDSDDMAQDRPQNRPPPTAVLIDPQTEARAGHEPSPMNFQPRNYISGCLPARARLGVRYRVSAQSARLTWDTSAATDGEKGRRS